MAKVGEFYISSDGHAWEKDRFSVREKMGIGPGEWRRIASMQSHFQAKRIMKALTEQAKRDALFGVDVDKEQEDIFKEALSQHAWRFALKKYAEDAKVEDEKQRQREYIARQFVAGKLTIQTPRGATIITKQEGVHVCTHSGGDSHLTITIE